MKKIDYAIAFIVGIASSLTANSLGSMSMAWIYEHLVRGIWPWYVGLFVALLYLYIKLQINIYKIIKKLPTQENIKKLEQWISTTRYEKKDYDNLAHQIDYQIKTTLENTGLIKTTPK